MEAAPSVRPPKGGGLGGAAPAAGLQGGKKEKLTLYAHEPDPGNIVYGQVGNRDGAEVLEVWEVSPRGVPTPTRHVVKLVREWGIRAHDLRKALLWDGGPVGVAETFYPHPQGWKFQGEVKGTMESMSVRRLTRLFARKHVKQPSCIAKWHALTGVDVTKIARCFTSPLLTPRDFKNYYRILHRSMATRNITAGPNPNCRLCGRCLERFSHFSKCHVIRKSFKFLRTLVQSILGNTDLDDKLIFLGIRGSEPLPSALLDLFVILWKFIVISFTRVDTCGDKYKAKTVWKQAVCRYVKRATAYGEGVRRGSIKRESRGSGRALHSGHRERLARLFHPVAEVSEEGYIMWVPNMEMTILAARSKD